MLGNNNALGGSIQSFALFPLCSDSAVGWCWTLEISTCAVSCLICVACPSHETGGFCVCGRGEMSCCVYAMDDHRMCVSSILACKLRIYNVVFLCGISLIANVVFFSDVFNYHFVDEPENGTFTSIHRKDQHQYSNYMRHCDNKV